MTAIFSPVRQQAMARPDSAQRHSEVGQQLARRWPLIPREHGAYAEVAFPLLTALGLGRLNSAQLLLAAATIAVFLAHEPLLIMAGERGRRTRSQLKERAQRATAAFLASAIASGSLGWWSAPETARLAVFLPLSLGALLVPLIFLHREKSTVGELLVALTFSSTLIPVALAGGVSPRTAVIASAVWGAVFSLATLTVRAVIASVKKTINRRRPFYAIASLSLATIVTAFLLTMTNTLPTLAAVSVLPSSLVALAGGLLGVHPRHLRTMGWSLVGSNFIALAVLLVGLR